MNNHIQKMSENEKEEELYNKLTKIMDKVAKVRKMCTCKENVS